jgi:hypothetical protein
MLAAAQLARMRTVQGAAMMDRCTLRTWAPVVDGWGSEVEGWTVREGVACGLDVRGSRQKERRRADGTIVMSQAVLRLSIEDGEGLTGKDGVVVTHRNGELLTPALVFGIDGPVERGATGVTVRLVEVS